MLGYRGTSVFAEFLLKLSSSDPRDVLRLSKIRAAAIESATGIVVLDGEEFKCGWTMLSPMDFNVRISDKFEEKILLVVSDKGSQDCDALCLWSDADFQGYIHCRTWLRDLYTPFLAYPIYRAMITASTKLRCSLVCRWVTLWGCKRV